jgi:hypothetical protein
MHTQGIKSHLEFSTLPETVRIVETANQLAVHPRHPYAGSLVLTAFSGIKMRLGRDWPLPRRTIAQRVNAKSLERVCGAYDTQGISSATRSCLKSDNSVLVERHFFAYAVMLLGTR